MNQNVTGIMHCLFLSKHILTAGATAHRRLKLLAALSRAEVKREQLFITNLIRPQNLACEAPPLSMAPSPESSIQNAAKLGSNGTLANDMQSCYTSPDGEQFQCNYPEPEVVCSSVTEVALKIKSCRCL